MSINTTSQVLYDGITNVIMQFTGISDGGGDQELNVVKVRVSDLNPIPKNLKITNIYHGVVGGTVKLAWEADEPVPFLIANYPDEVCYETSGGMINTAGDTATGNILLSTTGFDSGSSYTIKLEMRKKY